MVDYFHLVGTTLLPGAVITPGNYGRVIRAWGWLHNAALREFALEERRSAKFPGLPSRLAAAFVFVTPEDARNFRGVLVQGTTLRGFEAHCLYRVRLADESLVNFVTDHRFLAPHGPQGVWPDVYWKGTPTGADAPAGNVPQREMLTLSSLVIQERLD